MFLANRYSNIVRNAQCIIRNTLCVVCCLCFVLVVSSCHKKDVKIQRETLAERAYVPMLDANEVTTLISDSGITRYRITAGRWQIYDKAEPPYWDFPQGLYIEKFDEQLNVDASLRSDYARYNEAEQLWRLEGNVYAVNQAGEIFETPLLFWSQKDERVYSDSTIKITRENSIIEGVGFESNQEMTRYTIAQPTGVFPIKD